MKLRLLIPFISFNFLAGSLMAQLVITNKPSLVRAATPYTFIVTINGVKTGSGISWTVGGVAGGNSTVGTASGTSYMAPAVPPATSVTLVATANTNAKLTDSVTVSILNPQPVLSSVSPWPLPTGTSTVTINGSGLISGAIVTMNGAHLVTTYVSSTRLTAPITLASAPSSDTDFTVVNPNPGTLTSSTLQVPPGGACGNKVSDAAARRFLEQAAFGPDPYSICRVKTLGFDGWITEQSNEPKSTYPSLVAGSTSMGPLQARFFTNAVHGRDQLRQRIALALHKIWIVSAIEESKPAQYQPYYQIFGDQAFGNYRTLMREVTLSPAMGDYLDMRNNVKANATGTVLPNENYAREIMQLFTVGLDTMDQSGNLTKDTSGNLIPTYDQATVQQFARIYTGWTYPTMPGAAPKPFNPPYYVGSMVAWEPDHDTTSKKLLNGAISPAGMSASADLDFALDNIFHHANLPPFIAKQLIKAFVSSNPSPAYVKYVADVFGGANGGPRGDITAAIRAVLEYSEARAGDNTTTPPAASGALKEPVMFFAQTLRGLNAAVNDTNGLAGRAASLGQNIFFPPTVFSYFSPAYRIPGTTQIGPEFQLNSRSVAILRANQINTLIFGGATTMGGFGAGSTVDLTPWINLAATPSALVTALGNAFLYEEMPSHIATEVNAAITGTIGTTADKARAGLYVLLTSGYYAVKK